METIVQKHLKILNLKQNPISEEVLRKHYFSKTLQYHPDKNNSEDAKNNFHKIHESYEFLMKYYGYMDDDSYHLSCHEEKSEEVIPELKYDFIYLEPIIQTELFQDIHWTKILVKLIETLKHKCEDKGLCKC